MNGHRDKDGVYLPVQVNFESDYGIRSLTIPPLKTVTGILLFGIANKWNLFTPWTCEGEALKV